MSGARTDGWRFVGLRGADQRPLRTVPDLLPGAGEAGYRVAARRSSEEPSPPLEWAASWAPSRCWASRQPAPTSGRLGTRFAAIQALAILGAALDGSSATLAASLVVAGATLALSNTLLNTLLQSTSGDGVRGQTAALYMLAMRGGLALGNLVTGATVSWAGVRPALFGQAVLALVLQLLLGRWLARTSAEAPSLPAVAR